MTTYAGLAYLLNLYNLTGNPQGTLSVPGITLDEENGDYIITYTYFTNHSEITSASYYDANGPEAQHIVDEGAYNTNVQNAINTILNPTDTYSTLFSDVANISFNEETTGTGIIRHLSYSTVVFLSDIKELGKARG